MYKHSCHSHCSDVSAPVSRSINEFCSEYSFSEFIRTRYQFRCQKFVSEHFTDKTLPFTGNTEFYYSQTSLRETEIQKIHIRRNDSGSLSTDIIITAAFSDRKNNIYRFRYRISGTLRRSGRSILLEKIHLYRSGDIPEEKNVSCSLIPYLSKKDLDIEADTILKLYYPEALESPVHTDAVKLAENMGFSIMYARLSDDNSRPGDIFFSNTEVTLYRGTTPYRQKISAGTIVIDTEALNRRKLNTDDIIIHECIHAYEHYFFFMFCSLKNSCLSPEELTAQFAENSPLQWIEIQADHITQRVRMPLQQAKVKAAEIYESIKDEPYLYEKLVSELAEFYDVSAITVQNRLNQMGYRKFS